MKLVQKQYEQAMFPHRAENRRFFIYTSIYWELVKCARYRF